MRLNYRDKRGHYASRNLTCLRDQYWECTGVPTTNPVDLVGASKMLIGDAVERVLVNGVLDKLHFKGYHLCGTQVAVGGSKPAWNGYVDAVMAERLPDGSFDVFAVEIKTKSGYGASLFYETPEPTDEYMIQLGLYLKDLSEKNITSRGCFLYVLLCDKHFGTMVTVDCHYDEKTKHVHATGYKRSDGTSGSLNKKYDLGAALARWERLDKHIKEGIAPPPDYRYRYPITPESIQGMSDTALKKLIDGIAVPGDWQVKYSNYKDLQLKTDGISPEISAEERGIAVVEYKRRHPRSKVA